MALIIIDATIFSDTLQKKTSYCRLLCFSLNFFYFSNVYNYTKCLNALKIKKHIKDRHTQVRVSEGKRC